MTNYRDDSSWCWSVLAPVVAAVLAAATVVAPTCIWLSWRCTTSASMLLDSKFVPTSLYMDKGMWLQTHGLSILPSVQIPLPHSVWTIQQHAQWEALVLWVRRREFSTVIHLQERISLCSLMRFAAFQHNRSLLCIFSFSMHQTFTIYAS